MTLPWLSASKICIDPLSRSGASGARQAASACASSTTRRLAERRVVEEAQALAACLAPLAPDRLKVSMQIFEGESHGSVIPGALGRAARFAFEDWS
ncbi:MAG: hypothetical protein H2042_14710 [Rhizobiales bacterium]|nr:hypothetical protein [Hyphomicrobiales bacterium]